MNGIYIMVLSKARKVVVKIVCKLFRKLCTEFHFAMFTDPFFSLFTYIHPTRIFRAKYR